MISGLSPPVSGSGHQVLVSDCCDPEIRLTVEHPVWLWSEAFLAANREPPAAYSLK